ncbi:MAG: hypothetical protein HY270_24040, partial [Deltaproteobacteria bacterium]|nr:hypothetical protein [Deltaproteobacteria bacterium]
DAVTLSNSYGNGISDSLALDDSQPHAELVTFGKCDSNIDGHIDGNRHSHGVAKPQRLSKPIGQHQRDSVCYQICNRHSDPFGNFEPHTNSLGQLDDIAHFDA